MSAENAHRVQYPAESRASNYSCCMTFRSMPMKRLARRAYLAIDHYFEARPKIISGEIFAVIWISLLFEETK